MLELGVGSCSCSRCAALSSLALAAAAAAVVAMLSSLAGAAAAAAVVAVSSSLAGAGAAVAAGVILIGRGSCSCSRCCWQRDDECLDVAVGRYVTGTHGSCLREPIPVATGTGLARVWVRVQLELPVGYPCYALRITPPLMFRVIEEVVVGRDNADGKNNSSTCVSINKGVVAG